MNTFCGLDLTMCPNSTIDTRIPFQWRKNSLNRSSYEKVMQFRYCPPKTSPCAPSLMPDFHDQGNISSRYHSVPIVQVSTSQCVANNLQNDENFLCCCISKDTWLSRKNDTYTRSSTKHLTLNACAYGMPSSIPLVLSKWSSLRRELRVFARI